MSLKTNQIVFIVLRNLFKVKEFQKKKGIILTQYNNEILKIFIHVNLCF